MKQKFTDIFKKVRKTGIVLIFLVLNLLGITNISNAQTIDSANIYAVSDCGKLLTYKGVVVKADYVEYTNNGEHYPAYCLDKTKVGAQGSGYTVSVTNAIKDVGLWKIIINGYPYKSYNELGTANKEEAFLATKQAVYCYIHGNNINDYAPIGEAGNRTLNAMRKILQDANNSKENMISSTITINKNISKWEQDTKEPEYLSKIYSISAGAQIENYKIKLTNKTGENLGGIKFTDENNNEKAEFKPNEKFKILVPLKNMKQDGKIKIEVQTKIKTKPILYGKAPNSNNQDYALTASSYEDGVGTIEDTYGKNETKITIIKKDQETEKNLEGVEFEILDENKKIIYSGLKTNSEGKIVLDNLIPGTYYLKETKTIDGYELYTELIEVKVELNEEVVVTVNNKKEEKPTIEKGKITNYQAKKLPVTGM